MYNKKIIDVFEILINSYKSKIQSLENNKEKNIIRFKINNFQKALNNIKLLDYNIKSSNEIKELPGVGKGVISRIDEIMKYGTLKELNSQKIEQKDNNKIIELEKLQSITGIGEVKAKQLYKNNITLEKLLKEYDKYEDKIDNSKLFNNLTKHQIIGLKYYYHLKLLIPRIEISKIENKIKKVINNLNKDLEVIVCGSYRRLKEKSGDIDVLILNKNLQTKEDIENSNVDYLQSVIEKLKDNKILVDNLTEQGKTKYMGICKLVSRSKGRRIDIRFMPYKCKASALLYFTGSGNFNKNMRLDAKKKGYLINEYGLFKISKKENKLIETEKEEDIFKELDMEYIEPQNRI